ncbi:MAG TPA: hypothetical protein VK582_26280 [Pyrinomonadaceae bacterium]|nr:hypothetical protein [Pyrinomonadaceae bacterium]
MSKQNLQNGRPPVPDWIRDFRCEDWTNVFERLPGEDHLYGTETLFGNWNSRVLLLAKDWGPTCWLDDAIREGDRRPWRHNPEMRTNNRLASFASLIPDDKLYGSATANMLYNAPGSSRELKCFYSEPLKGFLRSVLHWVLESMPRVEWIACMGKEAWFLSCTTLGDSLAASQFKEHRDSHTPVVGVLGKKKIKVFPLYHPAALGDAINAMDNGWRAFAANFKSSEPK